MKKTKLEEIKVNDLNLDKDREIICKKGKFVIRAGALFKILNSEPNKVLCWDGKTWNNIGNAM